MPRGTSDRSAGAGTAGTNVAAGVASAVAVSSMPSPIVRSLHLSPLPAGKHHPSVERHRPVQAATARPNAESGGHPRDHVAEPDVFLGDEPGKAHAQRLRMPLRRRVRRLGLVRHEALLTSCSDARVWYAAEASSSGGARVARRAREAACAALAAGNSDRSRAAAP